MAIELGDIFLLVWALLCGCGGAFVGTRPVNQQRKAATVLLFLLIPTAIGGIFANFGFSTINLLAGLIVSALMVIGYFVGCHRLSLKGAEQVVTEHSDADDSNDGVG